MTHVFVGMSGGVDSSLSAALLQEQGYDVTGIYMKNWSQDLPGMKCPWAEDLADAKRVAVQLGIDLKVYDFEDEYRHKVVRYMIDEYENGRTPNPDIMCNQEVKFRLFLDTALEDGADMIATGHYAQVRQGEVTGVSSNTAVTSHGSSLLMRAVDSSKDQTYFLYRITEEALSRTLFPLGGYHKPEVREMAKQRGLWTADKKDSQGICFVGQVGVRDFLNQYVETEPGDIVNQETGDSIGIHDGAIFYTLGQRHGLDLGGGLPYYVVGKDMKKNEVYVSTNLNDNSLWREQIGLKNIHWIGDQPIDGKYQVRVRHQASLVDASLKGDVLTLSESQRAITAGQSIVIYGGDICLGGGVVS